MRAILAKNGTVVFTDRHLETPKADEIPVRVTTAGICETDLQLVKGYMGFEGVLGHEFVGLAQAGPLAGKRVVGEINCACHECNSCKRGLSNHCPQRSVIGILNHDGAFADTVYVPQANLHAVPEGVSDDEAVFTEPLAAAFQIPAQVDLHSVSNAIVLGDGRLGYLIAQVLRLHLANVVVLGKHPAKLKRFASIGIDTSVLGEKPRREFDLAVDCTGSPSGIPTALHYLRPRGILVLKTTVEGSHKIDLAPIVIDEITVIGNRCGPFSDALEALHNGDVDVKSLITSRYGLEQAVQAFAVAADKTQGKVLFDVDQNAV